MPLKQQNKGWYDESYILIWHSLNVDKNSGGIVELYLSSCLGNRPPEKQCQK